MAALALIAVAAIPGTAQAQTTAPSQVQTTVPAEADAYVDSGRANRNFGTATRLRVAQTSPELRSFLRFNVGPVEGTIQRVWLRIRVATGSSRGFDVRSVASTTWSETAVTFRDQPAMAVTATGRSGALSTGTWAMVDVTPLVTGPGRVSLGLTRSSVTAGAASLRSRIAPRRRSARTVRTKKRRRAIARAAEADVSLYSRETGTNGPQLVIESEVAPPPPPADVTPPVATLTAPEDGATVAGVRTIAADATDAGGVARVEFLVDGQVIGSDTTAPYAVAWDTAAQPDGERVLTARATDNAGNSALSGARHVTVANAPPPPPPPDDTTAPETTIASGPAGTYRSGIARFTFGANETGVVFECSLDGAAFTACASGQVVHVANGGHELRVRARDAAGNVDATPAARKWWADATVQNGTFEAATAGWIESGYTVAGWRGYQSTVSIVSGGMAGQKARVTPAAGASFYSMYDSPRSVDAAVAGRTYTGRAHVRSDTPGKQVCLEVVERSTAGVVGSSHRCVTAGTTWQPIPDVTLAAKGANNVYVVVSQDGAATGDSFEVDAVELADGTPLSVGEPAPAPGAPRMVAFGDIGFCESSGDEAMARLVDTLPGTIAMVGDLEQRHGSAAEFAGCFLPSWGRHLDRTRPAVGDHEYRQPGAGPYWDALGSRAGERGKGWYSYDLGSWHVVVLNSNCAAVGGCGPGSEQFEWLERDLEANATSCLAAYFHHPRFSAGSVHGGQERVAPFWDVLYRYGAEFVLGGNDHNYQRFAPQTPAGVRDDARGIRQFVVGTGGTMHYANGPALPNTQAQNSGTFGALELTLGAGSYDWRFVPQEGKTYTDTGSHACSPLPERDTIAPTVRLTEPAPGAVLEGTARVAADAADAVGVERVEFRAGERVLATDTTAPYAADVDVSGLPAGSTTLTAVAHDAGGNTGTSEPVEVTVQAPPPPPNLVANPSFETGLSGWSGYRGTLTRVDGGADGAFSARTSYEGTGSSYSIITTPVPTTAAGATYRAGAWLRSATPGRRVCLRLRETGASGVLAAAETCASATGTWAAFAPLSVKAVGGGRLDLYAYQETPLAGDSFDLDDARVTSG